MSSTNVTFTYPMNHTRFTLNLIIALYGSYTECLRLLSFLNLIFFVCVFGVMRFSLLLQKVRQRHYKYCTSTSATNVCFLISLLPRKSYKIHIKLVHLFMWLLHGIFLFFFLVLLFLWEFSSVFCVMRFSLAL